MPDQPDPPIHLSADQARGGEIELSTRWRRFVFLFGLVGALGLALVLMFAAYR